MKFKKEILADIAWNSRPDGFEKIEDEVLDNSRWSINHVMIFKFEDKYYQSFYSVGATEQQDESPYEYDEAEIECAEVQQREKLLKVWEEKEQRVE